MPSRFSARSLSPLLQNVKLRRFADLHSDFVNLIFGELLELEENPYSQELNLVLDLMKKASQDFNIFQWKTHYERLLLIVMTNIIKFEISMREEMKKNMREGLN